VRPKKINKRIHKTLEINYNFPSKVYEKLKYLGVDTLNELFEYVEFRNIVAFIKGTNFCHCIYNVVFVLAQ